MRIQEKYLKQARRIHQESPVVDAHFDLAAEVCERCLTGEQGVVERIQQRAARPTENGIRPGGAATVRPDVASMTRAQREALERRVLHGAQIEL